MKNNKSMLLASLAVVSVFSACKKNLPDERLSLGSDSNFTKTIYQPTLGRNTLFSDNFFVGSSSLPLNFKIVNMRRFNGDAAPELTDYFPVQTWEKAYDGTEKSLAEIAAKRKTEYRRLFEIREHSGQFLMWAKANSNFVKVQADSGYVFDVEVSNTGGRRIFKGFKLQPFRERPYEPSILNAVTGQTMSIGNSPSVVQNIKGARTGNYMGGGDILVQFKKNNAPGNSVSFKFVDSLQQTINPDKFAKTDWANLMHGFNMVKNSDSVKFDVAFPIPLVNYPTKYTTSNGSQARVIFRYERMGYGSMLEKSLLGLNFSIFEEGNWTILFWFRNESPKFIND